MSGPWYECVGPTYIDVRNDVEKIATNKIKYLNTEIFKNASEKVIPESRDDFGSWRGYGTFGVAYEIYNEVYGEYKTEIEKRKKALILISEKFIPYVKHHLWKPDGNMMKQVAKTTLIGKDSNQKKSAIV